MGAWLDTLRFRHEIATSLGIRRQAVGGFVAGQHGDDLVPLWSSVRITGQTVDERMVAVRKLRGDRSLDAFGVEIQDAKRALSELAVTDMHAAFAHGAYTAGDSGAGFDERVALHDGGDLPVENVLVELLQQLLVFAENLEMYYGVGMGHRSDLLLSAM